MLRVKGMFLKVNIFLGKEILLEGAGDSSFGQCQSFIIHRFHRENLFIFCSTPKLSGGLLTIYFCRTDLFPSQGANTHLATEIYTLRFIGNQSFSNLLSLLSLSLVWCQQTAGKFKSTIIDLLTTDIFLESFLQMLIQNALIVSCAEICLGHLASETSLLAKIES